ncbi:MAG TPA: Rieske 2Fe-2S domain-containing protein [Chitinophagaceae bacterium]|nr:Rieske 2Fe-2S domain-containing protein [Chitinophagaceae bacterium]
MDRREFIKNSCTACLSATVIGTVISSCTATSYISGTLEKDGLFVDADEFVTKQNGKPVYRSFVIVRNDALQYPVCVYRFNEGEYAALWMRCTHQGTELQASGDRLQCTAHGSEFDSKGLVKTGPADKSLRSFPVTVSNNQLFIDLRAI